MPRSLSSVRLRIVGAVVSILTVLFGGGGLHVCPASWAESPGNDAILKEIVTSLSSLRGDPTALATVLDWLDAQTTPIASELEAASARLAEIDFRLAQLEVSEKVANARIDALQTAERLVRGVTGLEGEIEDRPEVQLAQLETKTEPSPPPQPQSAATVQTSARIGKVDFGRDIRPIFANNCLTCHGPDEAKRKAKLRLDDPQSAAKVVKAGDPEGSEIYKRITATNKDDLMPPPEARDRLSPDQIALIRAWIQEGARMEEHWAFVAPQRPPLPEVKNSAWPKNPIDNFILAKLESEGLQPSEEADKRTLIRRLSFDLLGLPPTVEEVNEFLKDESPEAYEKVVDRYLSSQHYGERMAMGWLDLARYADSDGYHMDFERSMWQYRDWVIDAFNNNKPFDEFTLEQLAGDQLSNPSTDQLIATAFNRNGMTTTEGGADPAEYATKYVIDRVNTTGAVWLGLTIGCAECHEHKYDPISQTEYYQLYDYFNQLPESGLDKDPCPPYLSLPTVEQEVELARLDGEIGVLDRTFKKRLSEKDDELDAAQRKWEEESASLQILSPSPESNPKLGVWHSVGPFDATSAQASFGAAFGPETDLDLTKTYRGGELAWIQRPEWKDGEVQNLNYDKPAVTYLYRTIYSEKAQPLLLSLGSNDGIQVWLNGAQIHANDVARSVAPDQDKVEAMLQAGDNRLLVKVNNHGGTFSFYFTASTDLSGGADKGVFHILQVARDTRDATQEKQLREHFRLNHSEEIQGLNTRLAKLRVERTALNGRIPTIRIMQDTEKKRETHVLVRGDYRRPGDRVSAGVPAFLKIPLPEGDNNRLALAKWLVDPKNPLVSRVAINRYWQKYFGTGIVKTSEDFGTRSERPSHPELLDWLAVEFRESGWDIKAIQRSIVTSATYRQSSKVDSDLHTRDPHNRFLARGPRFRLPAELVRDNALAVSGLLDRNRPVGGPSVKPYQPYDLWKEKAIGDGEAQKYVQDTGGALYRRGMYTFLKRSVPYPSLIAFDAPNREICACKREVTNTPLQAFVTLNETTFVEAARHFAEKIIREGGDNTTDRLHYAFEHALARPPKAKEVDILAGLKAQSLEVYTADVEAASQFVNVGDSPVPADLELPNLAAWTTVASSILNLDEAVTKE